MRYIATDAYESKRREKATPAADRGIGVFRAFGGHKFCSFWFFVWYDAQYLTFLGSFVGGRISFPEGSSRHTDEVRNT